MDPDYLRARDRATNHFGSMSERLALAASAVRDHFGVYHAALDRFVERLVAVGAGGSAPAVGDRFPDFALPNAEGRLVRFDALRASGPVVVAFQRGAWCVFCQIGLSGLAGAARPVAEAGGSLVVVSPQRSDAARAQAARAGAEFPLLSDIDGAVAASLGLRVALGDELSETYAELGFDVAGGGGGRGAFVSIPATFVADRDGVIVAAHVDPDPRRRMEPEAILQAVIAAGR